MMSENLTSAATPVLTGISAPAGDTRRGMALVFGAALAWSFGGVIARSLETSDPWTIIGWRSLVAALFLIGFMLWRDGPRGTVRLFRNMGWPGISVGVCFVASSVSFIIALGYTSVANILLMQAGVPLIAALLGVVFLRERVDAVTWGAILMVIAGIAVMVSDSFGADVSPVGDSLALLIAFTFAGATVITRRHSGVRMAPAVTLGCMIGTAIGFSLSGGLAVSVHDAALLMLFGAFNLGLGLALFVTGARMVPSVIAALISTLEPVLGPIWVWIVHNEVPTARTLAGGAIVFAALMGHILWQWRMSRRMALPIPS